MKKIGIVCCATALLLVFAHCAKKDGSYATMKKINGQEVVVCDVTTVTDTTPTPLSTIVSSCELIRPQATAESLMKSPWHIDVSDNYLLIKSYGDIPVKLFSREGEFLRDIGQLGRGPGEYGALYGVQLDEARNRIYLTPLANADRVLVYDMEGQHLPSIPLKYPQAKTKVYVNGNTVTVLGMRFDNNHPFAYQQTAEGEVIGEAPVLDHFFVARDFSNEISSGRNAGAFDMFVLDWYRNTPDTLYHYNTAANVLEPRFVLEGKPIADLKDNVYENPVASVHELKGHYHAMISGPDYFKRIIVEKETLKARHFKILNDFYCDIELTNLFSANDGVFISSIPAIRLMEHLEHLLENDNLEDEKRREAVQLLDSLDENDNDIIFVGEMI